MKHFIIAAEIYLAGGCFWGTEHFLKQIRGVESTEVDYANSIPYLNKALEYIRKREKEEAVMLGRYMELYEGWQVDVSEWRLKNNFHRLTDARAGKFAKEKAGKIPAQKEKKCI